MRVLNDLILTASSVAMSQNSAVQDLTHMMVADVTAVVTGNNPSAQTFTVIAANAAAVPAHGFLQGVLVQVSNPGTLPTGLAALTNYYIIVVDADHVEFASSQANALAGTAIAVTDSGVGTTTITPVAALTGAIKLQKNNEPTTLTPVWIDVPSSSTAFTAAANLNWAITDIGFLSLRAVVTTTSGTVLVSVRVNAKGV